ncbi:MAG: acyltransferase family protein [Actinomycetes bacterium]
MSEPRAFRRDVQGLRAVAIVAVVLFHAGVPGVDGGFVGVDVFFVVSGFLITGLLWRELERSGRVSFVAFYARRARRLLPAASVVLVATLAAAVVVLSPLQARDAARDALAAALYVANYRFAVQGTDYLAPDSAESPLQHYWSLGVEEQFYLLWPALLLVASTLLLRPRRPSRRAATTALAAVAGGSFAACLYLTGASQSWAFFSLPTRAWELAAGGLVALAAPLLGRLPVALAAGLGWAGAGVVVASVVATSTATPFPGTAALGPVLGTAAVLVAGCRSEAAELGPARVLRLPPFQVLGNWSYSWYLWHWPVLVLAPVAVGAPLPLPARLGLAALTALLAGATVRLVENPIRFAPAVRARASRGLALGAALTITGAAVSVTVAQALPSPEGHGSVVTAADLSAAARAGATPESRGSAPRADARLVPAGQPPTAAAASEPTPPAPAAPAPAAPGPDAVVAAAVATSLQRADVPANLQPPLAQAAADKAAPFTDGCHLGWTASVPRSCVFGVPSSPVTVMLVGDSHATQWEPALDAASKQQGWRLLSVTKSTCPPALLPLWSPVLHHPYRECDAWQQQVLGLVRAEHPALVVLGSARHYGPEYRFQMYGPQWLAGLGQMVQEVSAAGARVVVLGPTPHPSGNVPDCLASHVDDVAACTLFRAASVNAAGIAAESATVVAAGGVYLDVTPWFCAGPSCAVVVDNMLVYRDDNHLSTTYPTWLAPLVAADLAHYASPPAGTARLAAR